MTARLRSFGCQSDGVATLEFAMALPLLLLILFGTLEATDALRASLKVAVAAENIADMVAQETAGVTDTTVGSLGNFCKAAQVAMTPLATFDISGDAGAFSAAIVSVTNNSGTAGVDWESDGACAVRAATFGPSAVERATMAISNGINPSCATGVIVNLVPCEGDSVIIVKVTYVYFMPFGINLAKILLDLPGSFTSATLTHVAYSVPRGHATIRCGDPRSGFACST